MSITFNQVVIGKKYLFDKELIVKADQYLPNHIDKIGAIYDESLQIYYTLDRLYYYHKSNFTTRRYFKIAKRRQIIYAKMHLYFGRCQRKWYLKRNSETK